jgi:hypothetical protein
MAKTNPSGQTFNQTANQLLLATSATNATGLTLGANQIPYGTGSGAAPTAVTLTAGAGIQLTNASGALNIAATAMAMPWTTVSANTTAVSGSGYVVTNTSTVTLPTPTLGAIIQIGGTVGGYAIVAPSNVTIQVGTQVSAAAGNAVSQSAGDSINLVGISSTAWMAFSGWGTFNVT